MASSEPSGAGLPTSCCRAIASAATVKPCSYALHPGRGKGVDATQRGEDVEVAHAALTPTLDGGGPWASSFRGPPEDERGPETQAKRPSKKPRTRALLINATPYAVRVAARPGDGQRAERAAWRREH